MSMWAKRTTEGKSEGLSLKPRMMASSSVATRNEEDSAISAKASQALSGLKGDNKTISSKSLGASGSPVGASASGSAALPSSSVSSSSSLPPSSSIPAVPAVPSSSDRVPSEAEPTFSSEDSSTTVPVIKKSPAGKVDKEINEKEGGQKLNDGGKKEETEEKSEQAREVGSKQVPRNNIYPSEREADEKDTSKKEHKSSLQPTADVPPKTASVAACEKITVKNNLHSHVLFYGIQISDEISQHPTIDAVLSAFRLNRVKDLHVTLAYVGKSSSSVSAWNQLSALCSKKVEVQLVSICVNSSVIVIRVHLPDPEIQKLCQNKEPHITFSHCLNFSPKSSNTVLQNHVTEQANILKSSPGTSQFDYLTTAEFDLLNYKIMGEVHAY